MSGAFAEGRRVLKDNGVGCVVFAHKTTEGWEALLSGMIRSGWVITGSWPITTEMATRLRARESAALATSVHLVCRPRVGQASSLSEETARMAVPQATTLDRVHAAMLLQAGGSANALRALLKAEQDRSPDFLRLANALSALYPKESEEKRLLDAMLLAVPR